MVDEFGDMSEVEARVLFEEAKAEIERAEANYNRVLQLKDFVAFLPTGQFIYKETGDMWTAKSVNEKLPPVEQKGEKKPIPASTWLMRHNDVMQMAWFPGKPRVLANSVILNGCIVEDARCAVFNTYRPPTIGAGDKLKARPWLEHVAVCFPDDVDHIVGFLAHAVQRPFEKVNHALALMSRKHGVGKDTLLAPVRHAVGAWNCAEVSPEQFMGRFNGFAKSVLLRVSEAKDLGPTSLFRFYDRTKLFAAAPPESIRVDEKHKPEQQIPNVCHLVITSNYVTSGIFLPAEDRRHYVAESPRFPEDFPAGYWKKLWSWFVNEQGFEHVAAYLHAFDLRDFEYIYAPPPKTAAFYRIVGFNGSQEGMWLGDLLDELGRPEVVTLQEIRNKATGEFGVWLGSGASWRTFRHLMEECEYRHFANHHAKDGCYKLGGKRQSVYVREDVRDPWQAVQGHQRVR